MSPLWFGILVVAYFVLDLAWVQWSTEVEARHPIRAGFWAVVLLLIGLGGGVSVYQHSVWYACAMAIGSFAGTWWAVRRKRAQERQEREL